MKIRKRGRPKKRPQTENLKKRWNKWELKPASELGRTPTRADVDEVYAKTVVENKARLCGMSQLKYAQARGYPTTRKQHFKAVHEECFDKIKAMVQSLSDEVSDHQESASIREAGDAILAHYERRHKRYMSKSIHTYGKPFGWWSVEDNWPLFLARARKERGLAIDDAWLEEREAEVESAMAEARYRMQYGIPDGPLGDVLECLQILRLSQKPVYVLREDIIREAKEGVDIWQKYHGENRVDVHTKPDDWDERVAAQNEKYQEVELDDVDFSEKDDLY
jgi:hypothetical protein